jgi:integrase
MYLMSGEITTQKMELPASYKDLPDKARQEVELLGAKKTYIDQASEDFKAASIDIHELADKYINGITVARTKRNYRLALDQWFDFCKRMDINPLLADGGHVDDFLQELKRDYAPATVRLKMAACSAFYTELDRLYHRRFNTHNPFKGAKLPKKGPGKTDIPDSSEIAGIIKSVEKLTKEKNTGYQASRRINSARRLLFSVSFMSAYGLRSDSLQSITFDDKAGKIRYRSKGKDYERSYIEKLTSYDGTRKAKALIERQRLAQEYRLANPDIEPLSGNTLYMALKKITSRSPHDFRHEFAVSLYKSTTDIVLTSRVLGHASIQVTENYLKSVGIEPAGI